MDVPSASFSGFVSPFVAMARHRGIEAPPTRHGRVANREFFEMLARLRHAQRDRSPGVLASPLVGPPCEPSVAAMVTCAPTALDAFAALRSTCGFFIDDVELEAIGDGPHVVLRPVFGDGDVDATHEVAATFLAGGLAYLTRALGAVPEHHAVLRPLRAARAHVRSVFDRVSEAAREPVLLVPRRAVERRLRTANDRMFAWFHRDLTTRAARRGSTPWSDRVRTHLAGVAAPLRTGVVSVAETLGIGTRTLQRSLLAEDTTFERIQGTVLRQRALVGLAHAPSREVARTLGYADASAFHRAVRAWSDRTPGELADQLRG